MAKGRTPSGDAKNKYTKGVQSKISESQLQYLEYQAKRQKSSLSAVVRLAIEMYINQNVSDTKIIHNSIVENRSAVIRVEEKIEMLSVMLYEQMKYLMQSLPTPAIKSDLLMKKEWEEFRNKIGRTIKEHHGGFLESMVIDIYKNQDAEE